MNIIKNIIKKVIYYSMNPKQFYIRLRKKILRRLILIKTYKSLIPKELLPNSVFIEVTGACNLRCTMCLRNYITEELSEMELNTFTEITKIFPIIERVNLMGVGEPLTNKNILRMISTCKSFGLSVGFNSNGVLLTPSLIRDLILSGLDDFTFSVDSATKELYEKIRIGANFEMVIENIRTFIKIKKKLNKKNPILGLEFVATTKNIHELLLYLDLAKDIGISRITISQVIIFSEEQKDEALYNHNNSEYFQIWNQVAVKAKDLKISLTLPPLQAIDNSKCRFRPWEQFFISWKGDIKPCCTYLHPLPLFYKDKEVTVPITNFGNVHKEDILKLWHSPNYSKFRYQILNKKYTNICKNCLYSKELIPA